MLVLFNTAYRPGYLRNVLRTIFLPAGASNEYRYTFGDDLQISESLLNEVERKGLPDVLICFGDRFSPGGYTFHPVRKGVLTKVEKAGGRVYFTVRLLSHVAAVDPARFTAALYEDASHLEGRERLLSLTNADPLFSKDGRYVYWCKSDIGPLLEMGEHAWRACSGQLAETKAFGSTEGVQYVFAKCDLLVDGKRQDYTVDEHSSRYEIRRNNDLRLRVQYFYPAQTESKVAVATLTVLGSDPLQVLGSSEQVLDMPESRLEFPFAVQAGSEKTFATMDVEFTSKSEGVEVIGAHDALAMKIFQAWAWWITAAVAIAVYVVGATLTAVDEKVVGEVFKAAAVVTMVLALGKKLV